jgi:hypothetical protein
MRTVEPRHGGKNSMHDPDSFDLSDENPAAPQLVAPRPRTAGSPLSAGASQRASNSSAPSVASADGGRIKRLAAPPSGRTKGIAPVGAKGQSGVQRAVSAFRSALPFMQRLLPLLDGNIASTVSNFLAPHPHPQAPPPSAKVDLEPIEDALADLRTEHQRLRNQVNEQNASLKRVQDQLEMVREATDRNTLEQQELLEDLKAFGNKVKVVVILALVLVAVGFLMTPALFLHVQRVLP